MPFEEDAVSARRLRQAVDLFLERGDQPLVVLGQSGQLGLRSGEPLLQLAYVSRALGQLAPYQCEFLLEERDLRGEIVGLLLPPCGARLRVVAACHVPPPRGLTSCSNTSCL